MLRSARTPDGRRVHSLGPADAPGHDARPGGRMNRVVLDLRESARAHRIPVTPLPHLTESARATWIGRMVQEHGSAHVFESLASQLEEAGLPAADVATCRAFAAEERTHGILCGAVV